MDLLALKRSLMPMSGPQDMGGGGGGGGTSTGTQTNITELPEWARGYAKSTLEKGAALSDKPYQAYDAPRIAGFSPMQQQAQEGAANMQTSGLTGLGGQVAGEAALRGLGQQYDGMQARSQNFGGRSAAQYMSPYAMQALQPTLDEQARQSAIQGQGLQARAVGQGAFGGSRQGLEQAENARNLGVLQQKTISEGMQNAYQNAQQQFNADQARQLQAQGMNIGQQQFGANLGLQGLQTALQGAGQLGALGGQQFQQGMDINKLQSAYGGQQQALRQQGLSQAYEDFQNQQNYPYKQIGFMSDLIRGLPLGQQSATQMYTPAPNAAQQVGALGLGAYGLSKFMAEGGMAYADGGSVDAPDNVQRIVSKLSDQQLQQAAQAAQARGDMDELEAIQNELGMRASLKHGIAGGITPQMADRMAGGGVVAFAGDEEENGPAGQLVVSPGNPSLYNKFGRLGEQAFDELGQLKGYTPMTAQERAVQTKKSFGEFQQFAGEDPYAPMAQKIAQMDAERLVNLEKEKGAAAFEAIPAILQGRGVRGIGEGIGKLGSGLAAAAKADAAEKRALASQDFLIKDAQRKERMGLTKDAMAETDKIEAAGVAAAKAKKDALVAKGNLAANLAKAYRPVGTGAGAGGAGKVKLAEQLAAAEVAHETNPTEQTLKTVTGLRRAMDRVRTSESGPGKLGVATAANDVRYKTLVQKALGELQVTPKYLKATPAEQKAMAAAEEARIMSQPLPAEDGSVTPIKLD